MASKITDAPGIGKALEKEFAKLSVFTLEDMACLSPRAYDDRREERTLRDTSIENPTIACRISVIRHSSFSSKKGKVIKITALDDDSTTLDILCFNRPYLEKMLRIGTSWYIIATVQRVNYQYQTASFEIKRTKEEAGIGTILPVYPLTGSLTQKIMRNAARYALRFGEYEDFLPQSIMEKEDLLDRRTALKELHFPSDEKMLERARRTLAFSELFLMEMKELRCREISKKRASGIASKLERRLLDSLPFSLTEDQEKAIEEIRDDLDSSSPMNRLLQGDVGAGKTLVAWLSSLHEIAKGGQVAFMAPTELLAKQHAEKAAELLSGLGVRLAYITGDVKGKERRLLLEALKKGEVDLAIGTHALFSGDIEFKNLRYLIIDEQHRFGVAQREALRSKGIEPHVLSMTATPIPRTLALTLFADLDVTTIHTMPAGRIPIKTYLVSEQSRERMYKAIGVEFERGHQAYFVYPRIDDEGESNLRDVTTMHEFLQKEYPFVPSCLIHSKLDESKKSQILKDFRDKKLKYLVSTSVVEVGIDIPEATCMVIEHADRFGLAALHQLRGRVGRSTLPSYCFLVFNPDSISEEGKQRLKVMRDSNDGFLIAEKDLEIRGPGEIAGNKQSGFLRLKFASLTGDLDLIESARCEAERILRLDRGLILSEHAALRRAIS